MQHSYKIPETWTGLTKTKYFFSEWLTISNKFDKHVTDMSKTEINSCLNLFDTSEGRFLLKENNEINSRCHRDT